MKLFLVRHGETDVNRVLGHGVSDPVMHSDPVLFEPGQDTDIALNVYGRAQATVAGEILPDDIDAIFSVAPVAREGDCRDYRRDKRDGCFQYFDP